MERKREGEMAGERERPPFIEDDVIPDKSKDFKVVKSPSLTIMALSERDSNEYVNTY
jgi:hypothetical protein